MRFVKSPYIVPPSIPGLCLGDGFGLPHIVVEVANQVGTLVWQVVRSNLCKISLALIQALFKGINVSACPVRSAGTPNLVKPQGQNIGSSKEAIQPTATRIMPVV